MKSRMLFFFLRKIELNALKSDCTFIVPSFSFFPIIFSIVSLNNICDLNDIFEIFNLKKCKKLFKLKNNCQFHSKIFLHIFKFKFK